MTVRVGHCLCDTIWARASYRFFKKQFFFYSTDLHSISFYVYCIYNNNNNNKGYVGDS